MTLVSEVSVIATTVMIHTRIIIFIFQFVIYFPTKLSGIGNWNNGKHSRQIGSPITQITYDIHDSESIPKREKIPDHQLPWQIWIIQNVFSLISGHGSNLNNINKRNIFYFGKKVPIRGNDSYEYNVGATSLSKWSTFNIAIFRNFVFGFKQITSTISSQLITFFNLHKNSFLFLSKTLGLTYLTVSVINRIFNWYKGIAETEVLLDKTDYTYHSYGFNLNGIGGWLIASFNHQTIEKYNYVNMIKNLENILDTPCFPRSMNAYATQANKDIVPILNELQDRLRSDSLKRYHISNYTQVFGTGISPCNDTLTEINETINITPAYSYGGGYHLDVPEQKLIRGIQRCVLLIQARQTDAILRLTRGQILFSLNTCEDLLVYWKARVMKKTQNFRLPLPRMLISRIPGLGRKFRSDALQSVQFALNNLNIGPFRPRDESIDNSIEADVSPDEPLTSFKRHYSTKYPYSSPKPRNKIYSFFSNLFSPGLPDLFFMHKPEAYDQRFIKNLNATVIKSNHRLLTLKFKIPEDYTLKNENISINIHHKDTVTNSTKLTAFRSPSSSFNSINNVVGHNKKTMSPPVADVDFETINVDHLLKRLNAREKVIFLEELQGKLYETAGHVQHKLDNLELVAQRLTEAVKSSYSSSTPSIIIDNSLNAHSTDVSSNNNKIDHVSSLSSVEFHKFNALTNTTESRLDYKRQLSLSITTAWEDLATWIHEGSVLCSKSFNLISLDMENHFSHNMNTTKFYEQGKSLPPNIWYKNTTMTNSQPSLPETASIYIGDLLEKSRYMSNFVSWESPHLDASSVNYSDKNATLTASMLLNNSLVRTRSQWNINSILLRDLLRAPTLFESHLDSSGLKLRHKNRALFAFKKLRILFKYSLWILVLAGVAEATKRSDDIRKTSAVIYSNFKDFVMRRITTPTVSIVNDVIFNNRVSLTDKSALSDATRSLQTMLNDFLKEYRPKMAEFERKRIVSTMDMTPISMEYETELKRPIQNLVSGRIARLVLIQLQFVKKELLMAMQAIDELFNANQVNMQLLAVTPAFFSIALIQALVRTSLSAIRSSSKGRFMESTWAVHRDLRSSMRSLEKLLTMSEAYNSPSVDMMTIVERGKLMSILYRLQNVLVTHSSRFEDASLRLLQEDLRELSSSNLSVSQRLALVDRILRSYSFFQPTRKIWPTTGF